MLAATKNVMYMYMIILIKRYNGIKEIDKCATDFNYLVKQRTVISVTGTLKIDWLGKR